MPFQLFPILQIHDAIIYETHVRDFSIDANSGMKNKGKFSAFTETGTKSPNGLKTGIDAQSSVVLYKR